MRGRGGAARAAVARAMVDSMRAGAMLLAAGAEADCLCVYIKAEAVWSGLLRPLAPLDSAEPLLRWPAVAKGAMPTVIDCRPVMTISVKSHV